MILDSRQTPAGALKGLVMKVFAGRQVAQHLDRSLDRLALVGVLPRRLLYRGAR